MPCSEILRPFFSQSTEHCTNIARMSRQQSRDAEGVVPYNPEFTAYSKHRRTMFAPTSHSGKFLPPQNRSALCVSTLRLGLERRCRFNSPISLSSDILFLSAFDTTICTLSACAYSARGFAPRPHNGFHPLTLTRDVSLDLLLASLGVGYSTLCGTVIPHSSLLT